MNPQTGTPQYSQFQAPPPPPVFNGDEVLESYTPPVAHLRCNKCNTDVNVTIRSVKKDYVPVIAYVLCVLGLLIGAIAILATRVRHKLELPFCKRCWTRTKIAGAFESFAFLGFLVSIISGFVLMFKFNNGWLFWFACGFGSGMLVWSQIYKRKCSPSYRSVDGKRVIVSTASGDLVFAK
jgi:hypothetical protein